VYQPSQHRSASDPLAVKIRSGMIGVWRLKPHRSMWPTAIVVAVLGEDGPQVPFTEDQDAVGEFGSDCQGSDLRNLSDGRI